ncbi:MAG: hypothetical protein ABW110_02395, partial [Steroidobacteraceae bacterium]
MTNLDRTLPTRLTRRQVLALLASLGVTREALAQDPVKSDPRSYRVVLENDRVRVLEYRSRLGLGVCGQGMHYHPDPLAIPLADAKVKVTTSDGKVTIEEVKAGHVFFVPAETHDAEVIGGFATRAIIVELKGKDWKPS